MAEISISAAVGAAAAAFADSARNRAARSRRCTWRRRCDLQVNHGLGGRHGREAAFATGTANVPNDLLALVHAGEIVIPADIASQLRNPSSNTVFGAAAGISAGAAGGGGGGGTNIGITLQANAVECQELRGIGEQSEFHALDRRNGRARYLASNPSLQGIY